MGGGTGFFFCKFLDTFLYDLSISLVRSMSVLDKSRQPVSGVKVDYESKRHAFNSINSLLYRCMGLLLVETKGMHFTEVYMYFEFEPQTVLHMPITPENIRTTYSKPSFIIFLLSSCILR